MEFYHGTTLEIREPRIVNRYATLDFGTGFYTTSNEPQAREFAQKTFVRRGRLGKPIVNVYTIDERSLSDGSLKVFRFEGPDESWLDFVVHNRRFGRSPAFDADVVIGPVADDNVFRTIDLLESGDITVTEAIARFKVNELFDQYLLCNEHALEYLRFVRSYEVV